MNNPIFIYSVNLIIECWFDYCFLKNYTFHKSTAEFCSFFFFSKSQVRASSEVQTHTNCQALLSCLPRNISLIYYTIEVGSKLWGGWGERKRERAFYFFEYCYFYRDTQREPLFIYLFSTHFFILRIRKWKLDWWLLEVKIFMPCI